MNLSAIVGPLMDPINAPFVGSIVSNTGYATDAAGHRVETTTTTASVTFRVQALSSDDLKQMDSLNVQGISRAVYINQRVQGLNRPAMKGGDWLLIPTGLTSASEGDTWLVTQVLEGWDSSGWCKVAVTLQNTPQTQ